MMFGLYRIHSGAKIVESSYDFDKQQIGPYKLPITLPYIPEECNGDVFYKYKYYTALLQDPNALAVFNLNNACLCVACNTYLYETVLNVNTKLELQQWAFRQPIQPTVFEHIGYERTYQNCLAVSQYPAFLLRVANSLNAFGYEDAIVGDPLVNPPMSLYRELINSEAQAVYFDKKTQQPKFLFK